MRVPCCSRITLHTGAEFWTSRSTYLKIGEEVAYAMAVYKITKRETRARRRYVFTGEFVREMSFAEWVKETSK